MLLDSCNKTGLMPVERLHSLPGMLALLDRLDISYKRARSYVYSPDPYYWPKQQELETLIAEAARSKGRSVVV
jgi:hypothetical protein